MALSDYFYFDYDTSIDKRAKEVEDFYKVLNNLDLENLLQTTTPIKVSWLDVRSVINGGKYYELVNEISNYFNYGYFTNYEFANKYKVMKYFTKNVKTFQKLMNNFKKIKNEVDRSNEGFNLWNIVKYIYVG